MPVSPKNQGILWTATGHEDRAVPETDPVYELKHYKSKRLSCHGKHVPFDLFLPTRVISEFSDFFVCKRHFWWRMTSSPPNDVAMLQCWATFSNVPVHWSIRMIRAKNYETVSVIGYVSGKAKVWKDSCDIRGSSLTALKTLVEQGPESSWAIGRLIHPLGEVLHCLSGWNIGNFAMCFRPKDIGFTRDSPGWEQCSPMCSDLRRETR